MTEQDTAANSNTSLPMTLVKNLQDLGTDYQDLCKKQVELESILERAKEEEESLLSALAIAEKSSTTALAPTKQDQERQAMKRLEEALMGDSSSDEESDRSG
jgi:predicted ribosome quality control (RQC) complex YloA/Tae2 family protein